MSSYWDNSDVWYDLFDFDDKNLFGDDNNSLTQAQYQEYESRSSPINKSSIERKRHQKRAYKPRTRVYIPKLVKNDIRNQYSIMYANVLNMQDYSLWKAYVKTYFRPDITLHQEYNMCHPNAPKYMTFQDSMVCCDVIYSMVLSCPDMVLSVSDVKICLPSGSSSRNTESTIVTSFLAEGTHTLDLLTNAFKVSDDTSNNSIDSDKNSDGSCMGMVETTTASSFDTNNDDNNTFSDIDNCNSIISSGGIINNRASTNNPFQHKDGEYIVKYTTQNGTIKKMKGYSVDRFNKLIEHAPMLPETTSLRVSGTFTMHLDENKMLTKFTVNYKELKSELIEARLIETYGSI